MRHRLLLAVIALLLVPCAARAQGGLYSEPILGANGRPVVGASAQVCTAIGTQGSLCTPTTTVYSNQALSTALTYPLATDSQGNLTFYVAPGLYYLTLYGQGLRTTTRAIAVNCLPGTGCALTGTASALTSASATPATSGVVRFAVGDQMCWRNNANTLNLCLSVNGADALLFNGSAFVQTNIANTFTQNQTFPTIISSTANPATGGWWRLANSDQGCWRNSTNTGNNCLSMNTDRLSYGGANVVTNTSTDTMTNKSLTSAIFITGINNNGSGHKHIRFVSCTTAAGANSFCTTSMTWTTAFADANYSVVCTASNDAGQGWVTGTANKVAAGMDVNFTNGPGAGALSETITCLADHD